MQRSPLLGRYRVELARTLQHELWAEICPGMDVLISGRYAREEGCGISFDGQGAVAELCLSLRSSEAE